MNGYWSPSSVSAPVLIMAIRSWTPGGGTGCQKVAQASPEAVSAKVQRGMTNGPLSMASTRPRWMRTR